jgi:nucleotide-binding universal stress UspA family protein
MSGQARATVGAPNSPLLAYPPCDLGLLRLRTPDVAGGRVLVTAGVQASLGIRLGTAIAKAFGGKVRVLHIQAGGAGGSGGAGSGGAGAGSEADADAERARTQAAVAQNAVPGSAAEAEVVPGPTVDRVLAAARGQDLVVVGASLAPRFWRRSLMGPRTQEIADRAPGNVLLVRFGARRGESHWLGRRMLTIQRYFQPE